MAEEANAVKEPVVADTTPTESAPVVKEESAAVSDPLGDDAFDDIDEEVANDPDTDDDEESEESETPPAEETEEQPQQEQPLTPKSENRFQKLANENRELKERLARVESQKTQVATEQALLNEINPETGDYYTPNEAERIARNQVLEQSQQQLAREQYNLQVQQVQETIGSEVRQVLELPIFNANSKEFNQNLTAQYEDMLAENTYYQAQDGNVYTGKQLLNAGVDIQTQATLVGANVSPLKLANLIAESTKANAAQYQANAQRSTEKMLAGADPIGGSSNANTKDDTSDFDEGWNS